MSIHALISIAYYGMAVFLAVMVVWSIIKAPRTSEKLVGVLVYIPLLLRVLRIK